MPPHRRRWMALCIEQTGAIDWQGYHLLTTTVPLDDFADLEELALVAGDRKFAWDILLTKNPGFLQGLSARTLPAREDDEPRRHRKRVR